MLRGSSQWRSGRGTTGELIVTRVGNWVQYRRGRSVVWEWDPLNMEAVEREALRKIQEEEEPEEVEILGARVKV